MTRRARHAPPRTRASSWHRPGSLPTAQNLTTVWTACSRLRSRRRGDRRGGRHRIGLDSSTVRHRTAILDGTAALNGAAVRNSTAIRHRRPGSGSRRRRVLSAHLVEVEQVHGGRAPFSRAERHGRHDRIVLVLDQVVVRLVRALHALNVGVAVRRTACAVSRSLMITGRRNTIRLVLLRSSVPSGTTGRSTEYRPAAAPCCC